MAPLREAANCVHLCFFAVPVHDCPCPRKRKSGHFARTLESRLQQQEQRQRGKAHRKRTPSPRDGLFLDRQGGKAIAKAHHVHKTAFPLTGSGKRSSQAHAESMNISCPEPPPFFCIFDPAQINTFQEAKIVKIDSFLARELPGHFWGPLEASLG